MSIHSKSEFCKIADISQKDVSIYRKRGKIFVSDDGTIDDKNPINRQFLERKQIKGKIPITPVAPSLKKMPKTIPAENAPGYGELLESRSIDLETKKLALKRAQVDLDLKQVDLEKKMGQLIPLDLVKPIVSVLAHSMTTEFKNYMEEFLRLNSKKYNVPSDEVAKNKGLLVKGINTAEDKAVNVAMSKIKTIVSEFSETRRVGEHD